MRRAGQCAEGATAGTARRFSDNAFTMLPWQNKTVMFVGEAAFSLADLQRSLSVLSIADTLPTPSLQAVSLPGLTVRAAGPRPPAPATASPRSRLPCWQRPYGDPTPQ